MSYDFDRRRRQFERESRLLDRWFVFVGVLIVAVIALVVAGFVWLGPQVLDLLREVASG